MFASLFETLTAYANSLHAVSCCWRYMYAHTFRDDPSPEPPITKLVKRENQRLRSRTMREHFITDTKQLERQLPTFQWSSELENL